MEAEGLKFGLNAIVSILFASGGALGFWYTIKGSVNLLEQRVKTLEDNDKVLHKRVESIKQEVKENREKSETSISDITGKMQEMELRIITAIHELGK